MALIGDATITVGAEPALEALVREMADEQRQCREYLGRLVALEEERRHGERDLEALAQSLMPRGIEDAQIDLMEAFFRYPDGRFGINEPDGTQRDATPAEAAQIKAAVGHTQWSRRR